MSPSETSPQPPARTPRLRRPDRTQVDPNPKTIDELVPEDHPVRTIWQMALELDLTPLYDRIKAVVGHAGRPAVDPLILTALWIYATSEGIASARELERRCYDCDPYKWLRGGVDVNYHSLADFRTQHADWLQQQVVAVVAAMRAEGLIELNQVGQDGMRVRASAGSHSFKKQATLETRLEEAQTQWDRLQQEFEAGTATGTPRQQAAQRRAARERLERLQRAKQHLQKVYEAREARKKGDGAQARASTTDPEARRMKMGDGGFRPAYNVQFATTLDTLVIVASDVLDEGDAGQMDPMVQQIATDYDTLPGAYHTDGGFATAADIEQLTARGVVVYTPVKDAARQQQQGRDPYAARPGDSPALAAWRQRMGTAEGQAQYKHRSKCEWSNAQCRNRGLSQFLVRGLEKVKAVVLWHVLTHNLGRWVALRAERRAAVPTVSLAG
jgi:transposase